MTTRFALTGYVFLFCANVFASFETSNSSARFLGMGQTIHGFRISSQCIFTNPALLAGSQTTWHVSLTRPYGMKALDQQSATCAFPLRFGGAAIGAYRFGNARYNETTFAAGCGFPVAKQIQLGMTLRYLHLSIENYGDASSLIADFASAIKLTPQLLLTFHQGNIFQGDIGKCREMLPQTTTTGISCKITEQSVICFDLFKDVRFPLEIRCGMETFLFHGICLRAGFTQHPQTFSAGLGCTWFHFTWDYAMQYHPVLGYTQALSMEYRIKKDK